MEAEVGSKNSINGLTEAEIYQRELNKRLPEISENILFKNESKNTIENAQTVAQIIKERFSNRERANNVDDEINDEITIYLIATEFTEFKVFSGTDWKYSLPSLHAEKFNKYNPFNLITQSISHLERVKYTFEKVLKSELPNRSIKLKPVPAKGRFAEKDENSQNTLRDEFLWLALNTAARLVTWYKLREKPNDSGERMK